MRWKFLSRHSKSHDGDITLGVECAWPNSRANMDNSSPYERIAIKMLRIGTFIALSIACLQFGQVAYMQSKAWLSQVLIRDAWAHTLEEKHKVKPWPWADTWPVSRIIVPRLGIERYVLAGSNGRTIAFGPGHVFGTAAPGEEGNSVIGGHRDTHFAFLAKLKPGDEIEIQTAYGVTHRYTVISTAVVNKDDTRVLRTTEQTQLTLVTCYPFDALHPGGALRYVVTAVSTSSKSHKI